MFSHSDNEKWLIPSTSPTLGEKAKGDIKANGFRSNQKVIIDL
jgi:hypothetical protein